MVIPALVRAVDLPSGFAPPEGMREDAARRKYWDFDTSQFDFLVPGGRNTTHQKIEGHLWRLAFSYTADAKANPDVVAERFAAGLEKNGWKILRSQGSLVATKNTGTGDLWISGYGNGGFFPLVLMQVAPPARSIELTPPTKDVEKLDDIRDFPFMLPIPGGGVS